MGDAIIDHMRDTEIFRHLLGLEAPWKIARIKPLATTGGVEIWVKHIARTQFVCPHCDASLPVYDHSAEQTWRHVNPVSVPIFLHVNPPRVACPDHGVIQVGPPWRAEFVQIT